MAAINDALREAIARTNSVGDTAHWQRLTGGYHNDVYRVRDGESDLVVKHYVAPSGNPMFPQLPHDEHRALLALAGTGLAPELVAFLDDIAGHPALVYRFVPGSAWAQGTTAIATLLARVHALDPGERWRPSVTAGNQAVAHARSMLAACPHTHDQHRLERLLDALPATSDRAGTCLIHTDCGPGNVIVAAHGAVLIDWQCPALGDPIEDLANFCSPAIQILYDRDPLTARAETELIEAYAATHPATVDRWPTDRWGFHGRIAAYCANRRHELRDSQPEVAALYGRALAAELALIEQRGQVT